MQPCGVAGPLSKVQWWKAPGLPKAREASVSSSEGATAGPRTGWSEPSSGAPFSGGLPWKPSLSQQGLRPHAREPHAPSPASPPSGAEVRADSPASAPPRPLGCSPDPREGPPRPCALCRLLPARRPSLLTWPGSGPDPCATSERPATHAVPSTCSHCPPSSHLYPGFVLPVFWFGCYLF